MLPITRAGAVKVFQPRLTSEGVSFQHINESAVMASQIEQLPELQ